MTQNVQIRWRDDLDPHAFNSFVGKAVGFDGIRSGFEVQVGTEPDRASIRAGVLVTKKGEVVTEDADLPDYFSAAQGRPIPANGEASARYDLIVCEFQYAQSYPNKPVATYHILEGVAGDLDFEDLPRFHQFRTPIAVARIPAGGTGYDLIAVWPRTHRVNFAYDHVDGTWKIVNGNSLTIRALVVSQSFADLFGWEPGIRIDMIGAGEKSDGEVIVESDWSNTIALGPDGWESFNDLLAEVVAARGSRDLLGDRLSQSMETNGDLLVAAVFRQWMLTFMDPSVKSGLRIHAKSGDATKIEIEPGVWLSQMGLRVETDTVQEIAIPDNTASAYDRWDLITGRSVWTQPGQPSAATYQIVPGTPDAAPVPPNRPVNDVVLGRGFIEAGATTYEAILIGNVFKHFNCRTGVDHKVYIIDGAMPAWIVEYQPNEVSGLGLAPWFKLFMHAGGVADDADITADLVEVLKVTEDGIAEIVAARGDFSTLAGRLNVVLNANGTLKANVVSSSNIVDGTIATADLADSAVTTAKIAADAITEAKIADAAVRKEHLHSSVVGNSMRLTATNALAVNADESSLTTGPGESIVGVSIKNGGVTTAKLDNGAVTTAKLDDGAVTNAKIGAAAVGYDQKRVFEISGDCGVFTTGGHVAVDGEETILRKLKVTVASGQRLALKRARYWFENSGLKLKVIGNDGSFTSASYRGQEDPDATLVNAASSTTWDLEIRVTNHSGSPQTVEAWDSYHLELQFE